MFTAFNLLPFPTDPRGTHLWEFIRDILLNPERNPGLIKWEDRTEGVFRFLKSEAVAQLWGKKKNNSSMTYEKLSRAMRYACTVVTHVGTNPDRKLSSTEGKKTAHLHIMNVIARCLPMYYACYWRIPVEGIPQYPDTIQFNSIQFNKSLISPGGQF